jgi:hypothetical protein
MVNGNGFLIKECPVFQACKANMPEKQDIYRKINILFTKKL